MTLHVRGVGGSKAMLQQPKGRNWCCCQGGAISPGQGRRYGKGGVGEGGGGATGTGCGYRTVDVIPSDALKSPSSKGLRRCGGHKEKNRHDSALRVLWSRDHPLLKYLSSGPVILAP